MIGLRYTGAKVDCQIAGVCSKTPPLPRRIVLCLACFAQCGKIEDMHRLKNLSNDYEKPKPLMEVIRAPQIEINFSFKGDARTPEFCQVLQISSEQCAFFLAQTLGFSDLSGALDLGLAILSGTQLIRELVESRLHANGWDACLSSPVYASEYDAFHRQITLWAQVPQSPLTLRHSFRATAERQSGKNQDSSATMGEIVSLINALTGRNLDTKILPSKRWPLPKRGGALKVKLSTLNSESQFEPLYKKDFEYLFKCIPQFKFLKEWEIPALLVARSEFSRLGAQQSSFRWNPLIILRDLTIQDDRTSKEFFPMIGFGLRSATIRQFSESFSILFGRQPCLTDSVPEEDWVSGRDAFSEKSIQWIRSFESQTERKKLDLAIGATRSEAVRRVKKTI